MAWSNTAGRRVRIAYLPRRTADQSAATTAAPPPRAHSRPVLILHSLDQATAPTTSISGGGELLVCADGR
jgi:hypothetical protein